MAQTAPRLPFSIPVDRLLSQYGLLEALYQAQERAAEQLTQLLGVPLCVEKCGRCCSVQTPVITGLEANYIVSSLFTLPDPDRTAVMSACEEWLTRKIPGVVSFTRAPEARRLTEAEKQRLLSEGEAVQRQGCPILSPTAKACLIHRFRPVACRAWGVTQPAAPYCRRRRAAPESEYSLAYLTGPGTEPVRRAMQALGSTGPCGFLPTHLYRLARPSALQRLVEDGKVAEAKLSLGGVRPWIVFEGEGPKARLVI